MTDVYEQPELPLAEASLAEHRRVTGHNPLETMQPKGWICSAIDEDGKQCMSSWPPPTPAEQRLEEMQLAILNTGRYEKGGLVIEFEPSIRTLNVLRGVMEGTPVDKGVVDEITNWA